MKTAVIYSGHARTFGEVRENHVWNVLRKLERPIIFASVVRDEQADEMLWLRQQGFEVHFETVEQPEIPEPPAGARWHPGWGPSSSYQAILRQLWALERAWEFFNQSAIREEYGIIVRMRPDVGFQYFNDPWLRRPMEPGVALVPWWESWGGINDRFALLGSKAAEAYFTTFSRREALWRQQCPVHPETMMAASLEAQGIKVYQDVATEFSRVREDAKCIRAKITPTDYAEYVKGTRARPTPRQQARRWLLERSALLSG